MRAASDEELALVAINDEAVAFQKQRDRSPDWKPIVVIGGIVALLALLFSGKGILGNAKSIIKTGTQRKRTIWVLRSDGMLHDEQGRSSSADDVAESGDDVVLIIAGDAPYGLANHVISVLSQGVDIWYRTRTGAFVHIPKGKPVTIEQAERSVS